VVDRIIKDNEDHIREKVVEGLPDMHVGMFKSMSLPDLPGRYEGRDIKRSFDRMNRQRELSKAVIDNKIDIFAQTGKDFSNPYSPEGTPAEGRSRVPSRPGSKLGHQQQPGSESVLAPQFPQVSSFVPSISGP
jgi:hypothetical protein